MPGFDQTGPQGKGPMSGGGRGICRSSADGPEQGQGGFGRGRGRRAGRGLGRGGGGNRFGRGGGAGPNRPQNPNDQVNER